MTEGIVLVVRRIVRASAEQLFDAWTQPEHLKAWWGPRPVTCSGAEVDLRVGGRYRIANALPDGKTVLIEGEFRDIQRPQLLVYTWCMGEGAGESSLVTVRFQPHGKATEVVVVHENVPSAAARDSHEKGWDGCLDGLERFFFAVPSSEGPWSP
jgi:uncharacterized protein YndB with AHSA1/START domain